MAQEYAKYIGTATTRRMTQSDWEAAGVKDQKTVTFGKANGYTVDRSEFTDDAWGRLVEDAGIIVVGEKGNPSAEADARLQAAQTRMRLSAAAHRASEQPNDPEAAQEPEAA